MNAKSLVDEMFEDVEGDAWTPTEKMSPSDISQNTALKSTNRVFHYSKLVSNPKNADVFELKDVQKKAESILQLGLLQDPLVQLVAGTDTAMIIAGHKRLAAIKYLVEELGKGEFELVRCKVIALDEINAELAMIDTNLEASQLSTYEMMQAIGRKEELLKLENVKGARKVIASKSNLEETQIGYYLRCYKKLTLNSKKMIKDGLITFKQAIELTKYEEKTQESICFQINVKQLDFDEAIDKVTGEFITEFNDELKGVIKGIVKDKIGSKVKIGTSMTVTDLKNAMDVRSYWGSSNLLDKVSWIEVNPKYLKIVGIDDKNKVSWSNVLSILKEDLEDDGIIKRYENNYTKALNKKVSITSTEIKIQYKNIEDLERILKLVKMSPSDI